MNYIHSYSSSFCIASCPREQHQVFFVALVLETGSYFHVPVLTHNRLKFSSLPFGAIQAKMQGILRQETGRLH